MPELIRPSTVLPAVRTPFVVRTEDGIDLVGEVARTLDEAAGTNDFNAASTANSRRHDG